MIYTVPPEFSNDWLNEYFTSQKDLINDDYRFVYMGPKGSWLVKVNFFFQSLSPLMKLKSRFYLFLGHLFMLTFSHLTAGL